MGEMKAADSVSVFVRRLDKGSHELVVENYSLCRGIGKGKPIESAKFTAGGLQWTIVFYPDGYNSDANADGSVSLYLQLKSSTGTAVQFLFEVCILDQSGKDKHYRCTTLEGTPPKALPWVDNKSRFYGYNKFIKQSDLESQSARYLKDDCLRIRATIGVLSSQPPVEEIGCAKVLLAVKEFLCG